MPRWIVKRNERRVRFDIGRLSRSLERAIAACGDDPHAASSLAEAISLHLDGDTVPTTQAVATSARKAFLELGKTEWAQSYDGYGKARQRLCDDLVIVSDKGDATPWNRETLTTRIRGRIGGGQSLFREHSPEVVSDIAAEIEKQILGTGMTRISDRLLDALTEIAFAERGMTLTQAPAVELSRDAIRAALGTGSNPDAVARTVGHEALGTYVLDEVYPPEVAQAHRDGALHIVDTGAALEFDTLWVSPFGSSLGPEFPIRTPLDFATAMNARIDEAAPFVTRRLIVPFLDLAMAPLWGNRPRQGADRLIQSVIEIIRRQGKPPNLVIPLLADLPDSLLASRIVVPGGGSGRHTYRKYLEAAQEIRLALSNITSVPGIHIEQKSMLPALVTPPEGFLNKPWPFAVSGRIVLNLAQAAFRVGATHIDGWMEEVEEGVTRATEGLAAGLSLLQARHVSPDLPLWRSFSGIRSLSIPDQIVGLVVPVGLNEAIRFLTGVPESDHPEAQRLGSEVTTIMTESLRRLSAQVGFDIILTSQDEAEVRGRLARSDRLAYPTETQSILNESEQYAHA